MGEIVSVVMAWEEQLGAKRAAHDIFLEFQLHQDRCLSVISSGGRMVLTLLFQTKGTVHKFTGFAWYTQPKGERVATVQIPVEKLCCDFRAFVSTTYEVDGVKPGLAGELLAREVLPFLSPLYPRIKVWYMADYPARYLESNMVTYVFGAV